MPRFVLTLLILVIVLIPSGAAQATAVKPLLDFDCSDFSTQAQAQRYLLRETLIALTGMETEWPATASPARVPTVDSRRPLDPW